MLKKAPMRMRLAIISAVVALCLAPTAFAAPKGGGGKPVRGGGTISLVLLESTDGLAHYGQQVTFDVATTATTEPWVNLKCYQGGLLVGEGWNGYFERSLTGRNFTLASPQWTGGAADCTAYLTTPQQTRLASTSFLVYP